MHPILVRIPLPWGGHFNVATYGMMMAVGTLAGVFAIWKIGRREGVSGNTAVDVGFWGVICGVLGAKTWFVIQYWGQFDDKWLLLKDFRSGLVYYGGAVGGAAGIIIYLAVKRLPILKILDIAAPGAILGLAFGRIGCFLNGCCYGIRSDSWLAVSFKRVTDGDEIIGSPAYLDQLNSGVVTLQDAVAKPVLPTELFSSAGALLVFIALLLLRRRRRYYGEQVALLFILYPCMRFVVEFFRGDHARSFAGLTAAQVFSLVSIAVATAVLAYIRGKRPEG
ncbi:MAG: prolipoprotein diacylglyceryl transferase, partial [Planctomycetes bacterium]|nr:prolipoprotein diacylglyceryl transferase [Planctomycetota bacterium]